MKQDTLIPFLLLMAGIMFCIAGIFLVYFGYWLASVLPV